MANTLPSDYAGRLRGAFYGRMHSYLNDQPEYLEIDAVCDRLHVLAKAFV